MVAREFVYFFQESAGEKCIKIGCSGDVEERRRTTQTYNPHKVVVLHHMPGGQELEKSLHKRFERIGTRRGMGEDDGGEWFFPTVDLLVFISELKAQALNRKILYRAWDRERKEFFTVHNIRFNRGEDVASYADMRGRITYRIDDRFLAGRDVILMEHTGEFDTHSKDIWEHDLVYYSPFYPDAEGEAGVYFVKYARGGYRLQRINTSDLTELPEFYNLPDIERLSYSEIVKDIKFALLSLGSFHTILPEELPELLQNYGVSL